MSDEQQDALERVRALVVAARTLADPGSTLGRRVRAELLESTGLSREGVELALTACLETAPSDAELGALVGSVRPARRVHVVLPSNVFVAAHRAVALALAASASVSVRSSRREPHFVRALAEAAPSLFAVTAELRPASGDELWAYGADASLSAIAGALPPGVTLHAQGPGFGVAVVEATHVGREAAAALANDIVPFEQRGCLSPRTALVVGSCADAAHFAELVAQALDELSRRVPPGRLDPVELADARAFREARAFAGELFSAGSGYVALGETDRLELAPVGRNLVVTACTAPGALLGPRASELTALGIAATAELKAELEREFFGARSSALGGMQRPLFDGPAD